MFFINGLNESYKHAIDSIHSILKLKKKDQSLITLQPLRNQKTVLKVYEYLLMHPIIDITKTSQAPNLSYNTIANVVNVLEDLNILFQVDGHQRYRILAYEPYLNILREGT